MSKQMLFIKQCELVRSRIWVCFYFGLTANSCRLSLTLYHDILWLIPLFVCVSRVILHGVLTWYSYLCWLILPPCQLLFSLRIRNINPAILMSTLWIIMISHIAMQLEQVKVAEEKNRFLKAISDKAVPLPISLPELPKKTVATVVGHRKVVSSLFWILLSILRMMRRQLVTTICMQPKL